MADTAEIESLYKQGFEARCAGNYGLAKLYLESVVAQSPTHVNARHQLGLIQGFEGDFDGSLETLQKIAAENPDNVEVRYDLAMTQMMLGMNDEAEMNFRNILAKEPTHEKALQQLAYF
jgi:Flp pilus assembly protein TadD